MTSKFANLFFGNSGASSQERAARAALRTKNIALPFNTSFYRAVNSDLEALDDAELVKHWQTRGCLEGRFANPDHALSVMLEDMSVPADFDVQEYLFLNDDLRDSLDWEFQAVHHYLNFGIEENRRYKVSAEDAAYEERINAINKIPFEPSFYKEFYSDLNALNDEELTEHWRNQGQQEGRFGSPAHALSILNANDGLPEDFDVDGYLRLNEELKDKIIWPFQAVDHYLNYGLAENRRYKESAEDIVNQQYLKEAKKITLEHAFYQEFYPDLAELTDEELTDHWRIQGQKEGRYGNPEHALELTMANGTLPEDFTVESYLELNADLSESMKWPFEAVHHYMVHGADENRRYCIQENEPDYDKHRDAAALVEFDTSFYKDVYPDLNGLSDEALADHWMVQGQIEGRYGNPEHALTTVLQKEGLPEDFDHNEYLALHKDLQETIVWPYQAVEHYLNQGKLEERRYRVRGSRADSHDSVDFDAEYYRVFYPDISGLTDEQCIDHWCTTGMYEGRAPNIDQYSDSHPEFVLSKKFNLPTYIRKNSDLIGHFDNKWAYFKHYLFTGRVERRGCIPDSADVQFIEGYYSLELDVDSRAEDALAQIRASFNYNEFDPVFLNEHELAHYYGFRHVAFLDLFNHEAYVYSNADKTLHLAGLSRARCLEHFLLEGHKESLQISYDHYFAPLFYGCEYREALLHLVRDEDHDSDDIWELPAVANRIYEHWVRYGIHEGKFANLSKLVLKKNGVKLPLQVEQDIEYFKALHKELISDSRPSRVYMSFMIHGIEEGKFKITHSVETCEFYCHIAKDFTKRSKSEVAIRLYEELLNIVPDYPKALHELGDELIRAKFYRKASECYLTLVESGTATEWAYLNLAECYKHVSDFTSAARVLKKAGETYPADTYINDRAKDLVDEQFYKALTRSKRLVKMDRVPEGRQEIQDALASFEVQRVDQRISRNTNRIAIIGNHDLAQCRFYRIDQKIELLRYANYDVDVYKYSESLTHFYAQLSQYEAVVFYRVPSVPAMIRAINATNVEGIPSIYDVDDLIFDEKHFPPPLSTYAGQISEQVHGNLTVDVPLTEHAISMCEYGLASTTSLASHMARFVRSGQVEVLRNGLSTMHQRSIAAHEKESGDDSDRPLTIFYGSGTKAHKNDFHDIVEPVFVQLHEKYGEKLRFLVLGHIAMTEKLESLGDSLELLEPVSDVEVYWDIMRSQADINLAVLSSTEVTDTKSEIKWIEAAMFGIPSVVSSTSTYLDVVEHGETGYICGSSDEFLDSLDMLVNDKRLRQKIGAKAKTEVLSRYSDEQQSNQLINSVNKFKSNAVTGKKKIAIVNVFYPPEAIGGATRVVHDNVLELKALHGSELDIQVFCTSAGSNAYATRQYEQDGIKVTAVACPAMPMLDHNMSDKDMGIAFARFLDNFKPDAVHFHCIQRLTESIVTETRRLDIPYVITAHDGWWVSDRQFLIEKNDKISLYSYQKDLIKATQVGSTRQRVLHKELLGAEKILAVSEPFKKIYESAGLTNVVTIENGVSGLTQVPKTKSKTGKVRLAHIGGLERHKGLHLLKNVLMSSPEINNLELLVIDNAAEYGSIRIEKWGNTEVTFKAKTPQAKVANLYSEIDVLVAPSVWPESYGLVTREALFCGCWVVASDRGAIGGAVEPGENGFVVSVDNLDELKEALITINSSPDVYMEAPDHELSLRPSSEQAEDLYSLYCEIVEANSIADNADTKYDMAS